MWTRDGARSERQEERYRLWSADPVLRLPVGKDIATPVVPSLHRGVRGI